VIIVVREQARATAHEDFSVAVEVQVGGERLPVAQLEFRVEPLEAQLARR
jgi:hypothetical protein